MGNLVPQQSHWKKDNSFFTAQKMKFSIKGFFRKCDQIRSFLRIWSCLLKKYFKENFIFCAVVLKESYSQILNISVVFKHFHVFRNIIKFKSTTDLRRSGWRFTFFSLCFWEEIWITICLSPSNYKESFGPNTF